MTDDALELPQLIERDQARIVAHWLELIAARPAHSPVSTPAAQKSSAPCSQALAWAGSIEGAAWSACTRRLSSCRRKQTAAARGP